MAKMNVATFLMGNISSRLSNELGEHERGIIINQMIESWEDRKYLHPLPRHETKRSAKFFSRIQLGLPKELDRTAGGIFYPPLPASPLAIFILMFINTLSFRELG